MGERARALAGLVDPAAALAAGAEAFAQRDFPAAERAFRTALALAPEERAARFNLGIVCEVGGRLDEAAALYRAIVERAPNDVDAWTRIGIVRHVQGRYGDAYEAFETILRLAPENADAAVNAGLSAMLGGQLGDATRVLREGVAKHPERADLRAALADALRAAGALDVAADVIETSLARWPDDLHTQMVAGRIAFEGGDFARAQAAFSAAAGLDRQRYEPPMNLGVLEHGLGHVPPALAFGQRAVALAPQASDARFNLAMTQLLAGDFASGFDGAEVRFGLPSPSRRMVEELRALGLPRWGGESLEGRGLLVAYEQGLGDFVLWSRLFDAARARGVRLIVEVPSPLVPLYRDCAAIDEVAVGAFDRTRIGEVAAFVPICSLPLALGLSAGEIPADVPYLAADPVRTAAFRRRFAEFGKARTVGLVWAGAPEFGHDRFRSFQLSDVLGLAALRDIAWISLQKGPREDDPAPPGVELVRLAPELVDFGVTAAAITALDLVVSVDTAVAHVAGALGAPVWTMHGFGHYWLWGVARSDSPWYPSMRLFRQTAPGTWNGLFVELCAGLAAWCASSRSD